VALVVKLTIVRIALVQKRSHKHPQFECHVTEATAEE
jgi:hypothetical protein